MSLEEGLAELLRVGCDIEHSLCICRVRAWGLGPYAYTIKQGSEESPPKPCYLSIAWPSWMRRGGVIPNGFRVRAVNERDNEVSWPDGPRGGEARG